ncbi:hypothetical protein BN2476_300074 [Paraburkholderia piptadeniae]|uniref:Uncharacterized protein n=1 Tax=Paraburkholderia piptadeniae TaxID=1701573 RepID=A0A1N7S2Q8_9BURK|nr:hypothetical protein [Paraburkholderia piptadeniae]SIT41578.1 hypothetical protein BN2476_300074 [Paraburkholderia piptadeniae]
MQQCELLTRHDGISAAYRNRPPPPWRSAAGRAAFVLELAGDRLNEGIFAKRRDHGIDARVEFA